MPLGKFANATIVKCTPPLLDEALFSKTGGYQPGRYCGLGSFEDGTTCCFPCPIQDYLYPPEWKQQLRVPNYLSILSVILCCFLLLSFAVLPASQTHRHYLSVGLLFPVLFISLSFVIPVAVDPSLCYDEITPNDMRSSHSCAWTGALVALGGLGCAIWVFLRSLWLHIRIFWDRDPGRKFKWASILAGTVLPLIFLIALLAATGFSYRMGQTCLPNHENAIVTFWAWLVSFAIAGFLLQVVTTGYCIYIYVRSLRRERQRQSDNSIQRGEAIAKVETWKYVKNMFFLQWRNILVSIFTIVGSIAFFIVFWTQDSKLGHVFNDPNNIKPVKTWIICLTLSRGDKEECRKYVKNFTVPQESVLTSLILASLVGIEIFILLFRISILRAWRDLFKSLFYRARHSRPPTPQLTSLDLPPSPRKRSPFVSAFSTDTPSSANLPFNRSSASELNTITPIPHHRPGFERVTSDSHSHTGLVSPNQAQFQYMFDNASSAEPSRAGTPVSAGIGAGAGAGMYAPYVPHREAPSPIPIPYTPHCQAATASKAATSSTNTPAPAPAPPSAPPRTASSSSKRSLFSAKSHASNPLSIQRTNSSKVKPRISTPIPGSFVHVSGTGMTRPERGPVRDNMLSPVEAWENEEDGWERGLGRGRG